MNVSIQTAAVAHPLVPLGAAAPGSTPLAPVGGSDFAALLREQLERVSQMQSDADLGVQKVLTGQSENIGDVFVAARKAEIAFSLLMEIRNKLVDAYDELRQLRV